jgi:hypothetical protein
VQLEALFRSCFKAAFPDARVQVATDKSLQPIRNLAQEVRAGEWGLRDIEEVWSRIFPMWWRFVTDLALKAYDRQRPDRFCAVTYLSEMCNYLHDHAQTLAMEAALGPLAPSALRRAVADSYLEAGGIRSLVFRDPNDASRQLYAMADYLRDHGVRTAEGVEFVVRIACLFGQAGSEGSKYWTPQYENIGFNTKAYLAEARNERGEAPVKAYAAGCVRSFAARILPQLIRDEDGEALLRAEMDDAIRVATCIALEHGGNRDPIVLFSEKYFPATVVLAKQNNHLVCSGHGNGLSSPPSALQPS